VPDAVTTLALRALEKTDARVDETVPAGYLRMSSRAAGWRAGSDHANRDLALLLDLAGGANVADAGPRPSWPAAGGMRAMQRSVRLP